VNNPNEILEVTKRLRELLGGFLCSNSDKKERVLEFLSEIGLLQQALLMDLEATKREKDLRGKINEELRKENQRLREQLSMEDGH